jgi:RimJ/RimL family protein N-acetyltransferase
LRLVYDWVHAHGGLTEHDDSPTCAEHFELSMGLLLSACASYGLLARATGGALIGILYFEPAGTRNGYLHIAMARSAWGRGLADEAATLCIRDLFEVRPELIRLSAAMLERNIPARALALRMGFALEGTLADMVLQKGAPRSVVHYGLTRRQWALREPVVPGLRKESSHG